MENIYKEMKALLGFTEELSEESNTEVKMMAEKVLVDGTIVMTDSDTFEEGASVFVMGDNEQRIAVPDGSYQAEDGSDMDVKDGKIVAISEAKEESVDEELSADTKEEEVVEETTEEVKPEIDLSSYMTKQDGFELGKMITEAIDLKIADLIKAHNTELEKVKKLSATKTFKNTPKSENKTEVKTKLSQDERIFAIFNKIKNR
tara:strand:- start:1091 stop:1699 length:609 start_codon:yes stop_codon:yes gene_type:complete